MKKHITIVFLLNISLLFAQSKIDSLQLEFNRAATDSTKIKTLHELFNDYKSTSREKATTSILHAIELAKKVNAHELLAKSYNKYGRYLRDQSLNDSAISTYKKSINLSEKYSLHLDLAEAGLGLGYCYLRRGDYKNALTNFQNSLKVSIDYNYDIVAAKTYSAVGDVYSQMREYSKGMENYLLSVKKSKEIGDLRSTSVTLSNIGMLFIKMENYESATNYLQESDSLFKILKDENGRAYVLYTLGQINMETGDYPKALEFSKEALVKYEQMGRKNEAGHLQYNIGTIYWRQKKYSHALASFNSRLGIVHQIKDSVSMSSTYKAIGDCYLMLKEINKAKSNYQHALDIALALKNDMRAMEIYNELSNTYVYEKNYKKAYENEIAYKELRNRMFEKNKTDLATDIEAKYQNEQKEKEITFLSTEKDLQALQLEKRVNERNVIIAFAGLLLILGVLAYNQYRIKQKANRKLQELDRLKSNFFANISHEFRTPLTLIKGPIEQLEQNPNEKLSLDSIKMIRRNTNRVLNLVNQLLDLSKIDEGNLHLEPTEIDVYKSLRAATSSFNSLAAQRHIDYVVRIPQTVLWASFDRDKLDKIVYNLLSNAFKFSQDHSKISIDVIHNKLGLQIQVSDSGKGIPTDKLPYIFDRFYQADGGSTKEHDGSGIGLSLSKELVELMDGTITVASELNKGSFFTVVLPIQEIKMGGIKSKEPILDINENRVKQETYTLTRMDERNVAHILLVEDNKDMRHFIKEQLFDNYKITEATNGEEAYKKAIALPPDLIISDLMMPKMDGIELCKMLKTNVNTSHIPIIMLTAKAGLENKIEGLETGADDYLVKPFEVNELVVRVKNLIGQRKKLRELFSTKNSSVDPKKVTVTSIDQIFLEDILNLLEDQYAESDFGVPQMQVALAMSKTQLHRKLKALTNEAPGELIRNFRLKKAAHLIVHKADSVTQIAYMVGFNNLSYFAKCFKELYGMTPSSYSESSNTIE
tara:strand:- start:517539 stop:520499 length:2961 start_codon:yes stop_codon:yes gene_type:complete